MTDRIIRIKIETGDSQKKVGVLNSSVTSLGASADKAADSVQDLNQSSFALSKTAQGVQQAVGGVTSRLGAIGKSAGQAGIQFSQLAGQIQGGTSAFVAISQQAADLGFVLGAPLLGAIVSIGAVVGGLLFNSMSTATSSVEELTDKLKKLRDEAGLTANQTELLSEEEKDSLEVKYATIKALEDEIRRNEELIKIRTSAGTAGDTGQFAIPRSADENAQKFADQIERARREIIKSRAEVDLLNSEIEQSKSNIDQYSEGAIQAAKKQELISDITTELNQRLKIAEARASGGEAAAAKLAIAFKLGLNSAEQLPPELAKAVDLLRAAELAAKGTASEFDRLRNVASGIDKLFSGDVSLFGGTQNKSQTDESSSRINSRIEGLRLETQTISSELALQQAVRQGFLTQEQADLDLQTATKIQKAITERELLLSEKNITDEQRIAAEIAFNDNVAAISQFYADQRLEVERQTGLQIQEIQNQTQQNYLDTASTAIGALTSLVGGSSKAAKALKLVQGGVNAFQVFAASEAAAALVLATPPGPVLNPSLIPLAASISAKGKASAAAILAGAAASTFSGGGGGGLSGISGAASSAALPTTPTSAPTVGSFEITGLSELQRQLDELDNDEVLPVSFTRRLVASLNSVQRLEGGE